MTPTISMLKLTPRGLKSGNNSPRTSPTNTTIPIEFEPLTLPSPVFAPPRRSSTFGGSPASPSRPTRGGSFPNIKPRKKRSNSWSAIMGDDIAGANVPTALMAGVPMLKISSKKIKQVIMKLDDGNITWVGANNSKVPLSQIREIRLGEPPSETYNSSRWITIVYVRGSQWKVLHMVALTNDIYELWVSALPTLVSETSDRTIGDVRPCDPDLLWIRQLWPAGSKVIDMPTAIGLCRSIGLVVPEKIDPKSQLDMSDFRQLIRDSQSRPEFESLFAHLSGGGEFLYRDQVERFLRDVQKMDPGDIFDRYASKEVWTVNALGDFLSSSDNVVKIKEDMTHSIVDYYISSSHNTYLVGEQWRGESTIEGYVRVLLGGCRCVEIDVFDGDFEPIVHHRKTLTTSIPVRDICRAINKYAFIASPYPLIISAEMHCTSEQQDRLAIIMKDMFGDKLVSKPIMQESRIPSPEELKYRILFKTKPKEETPSPSAPTSPNLLARFESYDSTDSTTTESSEGALVSIVRRMSVSTGPARHGRMSISNGHSGHDRSPFSAALSELMVYTAGVKYRGFSKLNRYEPHQQFSLSDRTAQKILKDSKTDWIKHNFTHLTRIYPHGIRMNSSNYDPRPLWASGCQLVALNWQTPDQHLLYNDAMFVDTPGYVLKPIALRQKTIEYPAKYRISVQIISAQRLPLSSDLFIEATLGDYDVKRTTTVKGTALNPRWDETMSWTIQATPTEFDLTFLHLAIKNRNLLAQWIRPLSTAPRGYHHLPLYDSLSSKYVFATLFVRIDVEKL